MEITRSFISGDHDMTDNRNPFAEIEAMKAIATALSDLEDEAIARVIRWQIDQYGVEVARGGRLRPKGGTPETPESGLLAESIEFDTAAELMAAANPRTDVEKVLVAGYWFQVVQNQSDLEGQTINTELKHQGHGVKNVTNAFAGLMSQKPQLAIQLRKAGTSKQARKKYKLTTEGIKKVQRMIAGLNGSENDE
jgi:hypothetical protein